MKTSRRDFLKLAVGALAGAFARKAEPEDDPYEWRWVEGCEEKKPVESGGVFYGTGKIDWPPPVSIISKTWDGIDDIINTGYIDIQTQRYLDNAPWINARIENVAYVPADNVDVPELETKPRPESTTHNNSATWKEWSESADGEVWYTVDGATWEQGDSEQVARLQGVLDGCDCDPDVTETLREWFRAFDGCEPVVTFHYDECDTRTECEGVHLTFRAESVECMSDGSTVYHNARAVDPYEHHFLTSWDRDLEGDAEDGWWSWYDPQAHTDIDQGNIFSVSDCGRERLIVCVPAENAPELIEALETRWG